MPPVVLLAKTFLDSRPELPASEARRIDRFIQKMTDNPANPGMGLERLRDGPDENMWAARVSKDLRAILHHDGDRYMLLHVNRHDAAYDWAKRRRVCPHPKTGAIQIIVVPEVEEERETVPSAPPAECEDPNLNFGRFTADYLLRLGVPEDWVPLVQRVRTEEDFWRVYEDLPEEPAELLYALALGEEVTPPKCIPPKAGVEANPDNLRRLHIVSGSEEFQALLTQPFEAWRLYLHPSQRYLSEGDFHGPVKVTGAAGTGKTVVAVHRARRLSRQGKRVLLTTFSRRLREDIARRATALCSTEERSRITISTVHRQALTTLNAVRPRARGENSGYTRRVLEENLPEPLNYSKQFLVEEWQHVVKQQGILSLDEYRDATRVGRGTPLGPSDRERVWELFAPALEELLNANLLPWSIVCRKAREAVEAGTVESSYDAVVIDEVQDLNVQEIRFLAAMVPQGSNNLMLIGDAGQRIYPGGFSLRSLGIETRGRSRTLNINYRTTREIAKAASHLRGGSVDNLDDGEDPTKGIQDLLSGEPPILKGSRRYEEEQDFVGAEIAKLIEEGTPPGDIGVFARAKDVRYWFQRELERREIPFIINDDRRQENTGNEVFLSTMHGAKGLEFRYVFVVGCDRGKVPSQAPVEMAADQLEREAALQREKSLLYVSMTRARERLYVTWTGWPSRFLDGLVREVG